ncbi:leucine dehydrogenase [Sinobacterium caligoides]|uniref:Leucine dehydrogenase n=1 Tax=Sinobacterium caligoides TaxID=933926 RepID=A0A3N2DZ05_9GAMM|nr:Glu/Leu/Phe/Val dehydrogenase dimerization domain-containing protein [Sinobacterium caligoides]ROS05068.1 leucine dehydrogenase [Sinobacterium caligoides]
MKIFDNPHDNQHEYLAFCNDRDSGLRAIIAIHNTTLGPAVGGCRMFNYATEQDAIDDALQLSEAMTYKAAMANLPYGGGKSIIIGDPSCDKSTAKFHAMGDFIERLQGAYISAEDAGTNGHDLTLIRQRTGYVFGVRPDPLGFGGYRKANPSPATAYGVYLGIKQALQEQRGSDSLSGIRVAIQGVGNVGYALCKLLHTDGARLWASDTNPKQLQRASLGFGAMAVDNEEIHRLDVDVFAPCAMGQSLNHHTAPQLLARIVAGSANNQCSHIEIAERLHQRGVLLCPDFVINAGGLIDLAHDFDGRRHDFSLSLQRIPDNLAEIFTAAKQQNLSPVIIAQNLALQRLQSIPSSHFTHHLNSLRGSAMSYLP